MWNKTRFYYSKDEMLFLNPNYKDILTDIYIPEYIRRNNPFESKEIPIKRSQKYHPSYSYNEYHYQSPPKHESLSSSFSNYQEKELNDNHENDHDFKDHLKYQTFNKKFGNENNHNISTPLFNKGYKSANNNPRRRNISESLMESVNLSNKDVTNKYNGPREKYFVREDYKYKTAINKQLNNYNTERNFDYNNPKDIANLFTINFDDKEFMESIPKVKPFIENQHISLRPQYSNSFKQLNPSHRHYDNGAKISINNFTQTTVDTTRKGCGDVDVKKIEAYILNRKVDDVTGISDKIVYTKNVYWLDFLKDNNNFTLNNNNSKNYNLFCLTELLYLRTINAISFETLITLKNINLINSPTKDDGYKSMRFIDLISSFNNNNPDQINETDLTHCSFSSFLTLLHKISREIKDSSADYKPSLNLGKLSNNLDGNSGGDGGTPFQNDKNFTSTYQNLTAKTAPNSLTNPLNPVLINISDDKLGPENIQDTPLKPIKSLGDASSKKGKKKKSSTAHVDESKSEQMSANKSTMTTEVGRQTKATMTAVSAVKLNSPTSPPKTISQSNPTASLFLNSTPTIAPSVLFNNKTSQTPTESLYSNKIAPSKVSNMRKSDLYQELLLDPLSQYLASKPDNVAEEILKTQILKDVSNKPISVFSEEEALIKKLIETEATLMEEFKKGAKIITPSSNSNDIDGWHKIPKHGKKKKKAQLQTSSSDKSKR